jgi:hypothetical protein
LQPGVVALDGGHCASEAHSVSLALVWRLVRLALYADSFDCCRPQIELPWGCPYTILPRLGLCISLGTPTVSLSAWIISQDTSNAPSGMAIFTRCVLSMEIPEFGDGVWSVLGVRSQGLWLQLMCCALMNCSSSISEFQSRSPESKRDEVRVVCRMFKWTKGFR